MVSASSWSWVTMSVVRPSRRCSARISIRTSAAQLGVEVRQRLVQQEHGRVDDQGAGQRHPLLLPARQLPRQPLLQRVEPHQAQRFPHPRVALGAADPAHLQPERDVGGHVHVREQRVGLEHHAGVARVRRLARHVLAADQHAPGGRRHEARDHAERGGLAAARGAEQRHHLALRHVEIHALHRDGGAVALAQGLQDQAPHHVPSRRRAGGHTTLAMDTKRSVTSISAPTSRICTVATAASVGSMRNSR